jgi:hypothetical protein
MTHRKTAQVWGYVMINAIYWTCESYIGVTQSQTKGMYYITQVIGVRILNF